MLLFMRLIIPAEIYCPWPVNIVNLCRGGTRLAAICWMTSSPYLGTAWFVEAVKKAHLYNLWRRLLSRSNKSLFVNTGSYSKSYCQALTGTYPFTRPEKLLLMVDRRFCSGWEFPRSNYDFSETWCAIWNNHIAWHAIGTKLAAQTK